MGAVTLGVADLSRSIAYYEDTIGLTLRHREDARAELGTAQGPLLRLVEKPTSRAEPGSPGLFHFALVVPTRADLGRTLAHFVRDQIPLQGVADHDVSEALYLEDPDGHGIEIYRDRPRSEWPYEDGELRMGTLPLDAEGILKSATGESASHLLAPETAMGHVHLRVSTLPPTTRFFEQVIGLSLMIGMPGALFFAADGYHHHIGANVWQSRNRASRDPASLGLESFDLVVPDSEMRSEIVKRADASEFAVYEHEGGAVLTAMDGIACELISA
jgi:catechol 2,3-dioxygenase